MQIEERAIELVLPYEKNARKIPRSSMIAAEQSDRIGYGIELNPLYVDLIVRRWQTFTEKEATLEADGRTFKKVESARKKEK